MAVGLVFVALTAGLSGISWALISPTQTADGPNLFGVDVDAGCGELGAHRALHYPITAIDYRDADLPSWFWLDF